MKKRIGILAIVIAATALVAVPFLYAAGPHSRGLGIFDKLHHVKEELDLSDAQADQIKTIFRETHEQNAATREQMRGGMHAVTTLLLTDPNNIAGAQALLDQQAAAERTMKQNMLVAASKALNVLTAEQRTKLAQLIGERHARRRSRR